MDTIVIEDEAKGFEELCQATTRATSDRFWGEARDIAEHTGISLGQALQRLTKIYRDPKLAQYKDQVYVPGTLVTNVRHGSAGNIEVTVVPFVEKIATMTEAQRIRAIEQGKRNMALAVGLFEILQGFGRRPATALPLMVLGGRLESVKPPVEDVH